MWPWFFSRQTLTSYFILGTPFYQPPFSNLPLKIMKNTIIWANYNNSLTWIVRPWMGMISRILTMISSEFARSELVIIYPASSIKLENSGSLQKSSNEHSDALKESRLFMANSRLGHFTKQHGKFIMGSINMVLQKMTWEIYIKKTFIFREKTHKKNMFFKAKAHSNETSGCSEPLDHLRDQLP